MDAKMVNTDGLLFLCAWADRTQQNRRAVTEELAKFLDPDGVHLLARVLAFHNDQPVDRVQVYAKMRQSMDPERFMLDVPHDKYEGLPDVPGCFELKEGLTDE